MYVSQRTEYGISYDGYGSRDGTGKDDFWKYDDGDGTGTDYFWKKRYGNVTST